MMLEPLFSQIAIDVADPTRPHAVALLILGASILTVVGMIVVLKLNAFLALITSAMLVSVLGSANQAFFAAGEVDWTVTIRRVADAFGSTAGGIGVVIALAAVIGKCMMDSGAADRVVRVFINLFGERRSHVAIMSSGYVLSIPVFFDTVFYLLVPLARSLYRRTKKNYLLYLLAIAAGGGVTHTLVPPTPGPLLMAENLRFDVGWMIIVGALVAVPMAAVGLSWAVLVDRRMPIPMRTIASEPEPAPLPDERLPPLWLSLLPVVLPVLLISANTITGTMARLEAGGEPGMWHAASTVTNIFGNPNLALLLAAAVALGIYYRQRRPSRLETSKLVEGSLMSAGLIILITAAGGAFGAMLREAEIGDAIRHFSEALSGEKAGGMFLLLLGFGVAVLLKIAQGSSTVAMIAASGMVGAMLTGDAPLPFHPVYLATAIGSGSLFGSWMNDSAFWIFTKMGGLTEVEALKSWTPMVSAMSVTGMLMTLLLAIVMPLAG